MIIDIVMKKIHILKKASVLSAALIGGILNKLNLKRMQRYSINLE